MPNPNLQAILGYMNEYSTGLAFLYVLSLIAAVAFTAMWRTTRKPAPAPAAKAPRVESERVFTVVGPTTVITVETYDVDVESEGDVRYLNFLGPEYENVEGLAERSTVAVVPYADNAIVTSVEPDVKKWAKESRP